MKWFLVNLMTGIRLVLGLLFAVLIFQDLYRAAAGVLCLVYLSDFFDGYLARKWSVATSGGALFDLTADALFVCMAYAALTIIGAMPLWFFLLAVLKFAEFAATSTVLSRASVDSDRSQKRAQTNLPVGWSRWIPIFDSLGKASGILFMLTPLIIVGLYGLFPYALAAAFLAGFELLIAAGAGVSSVRRVYLCYQVGRQKPMQDSFA